MGESGTHCVQQQFTALFSDFKETNLFTRQHDEHRLTLVLQILRLIIQRAVMMDRRPNCETEPILDTNVLRRNYATTLLTVSFV
jgi:hypothetical protein